MLTALQKDIGNRYYNVTLLLLHHKDILLKPNYSRYNATNVKANEENNTCP